MRGERPDTRRPATPVASRAAAARRAPATASQPRLCSPKCERARAPASTPGRSASADCTATSAASSPRGARAPSAREVSSMRGRFQQHGLPLLLAGEHGQRLPVGLAHVVERAGPACAGDAATPATARTSWPGRAGGTPRRGRRRWSRSLRRRVHSRNQRESWVGTLSCGRSWCAGSALAEVVQHAAERVEPPCPVGFSALRRGQRFPTAAGSAVARRQHHRVGVLPAHRAHLRQRRLQDGEDVLGAGEEVVHRLVLDGDGRILKAQKVFERRLQMAAQPGRATSPSQCRAATTSRLRRWK